MIIYLDQNKWIELARIVHGKDGSTRAKRIVHALEAVTNGGHATLPLSASHYIETSRISNQGRKARLGTTMWKFSKGKTIASYPHVVRHELDHALATHFPAVRPRGLELLGFGVAHAFGEAALRVPPGLSEELERTVLVGNAELRIEPPASRSTHQRENFRQHLSTLHERASELNRDLHENFLYAISVVDILEPIREAMQLHALPPNSLELLGETGLRSLVNAMPTRRVDLHLHKQVLRNPRYVARHTDLEDWASLTVASCYCDVVVCEKHMASMLTRDRFGTRARIEVNLDRAFTILG
jgi:hypothetical protein